MRPQKETPSTTALFLSKVHSGFESKSTTEQRDGLNFSGGRTQRLMHGGGDVAEVRVLGDVYAASYWCAHGAEKIMGAKRLRGCMVPGRH